MREILFRGKRMCNGKWMYGSLLCYEDGDRYICSGNFRVNHYRVDPETVGQFTGMTDKNDKNGKKIFEGDVLRIKERGYTADGGIVVFENGYPGGWLIMDKTGKSKCSLAMRNDVEVIGNIHDNPDDGGADNG